jgi:hypothetical protein
MHDLLCNLPSLSTCTPPPSSANLLTRLGKFLLYDVRSDRPKRKLKRQDAGPSSNGAQQLERQLIPRGLAISTDWGFPNHGCTCVSWCEAIP